MAVPTFVQRGNSNAASGGNVAPPYPGTFAAGDLFLVCLMIRDTTSTPTTPTGWTLLYGPEGPGSGHRAWVYGKKADGTETGSLTITTDASAGTLVFACMFAFNGWLDTGTLTDAIEGAATSSGTDASIEDAGVTTTAADRLAVAFVTASDDQALDPFTGETGGDWVEPTTSLTTTIGNDGAMQLQTAGMSSAGTIDGGSTTMALATPWFVRAFALKPVAGGGGGGNSHYMTLLGVG